MLPTPDQLVVDNRQPSRRLLLWRDAMADGLWRGAVDPVGGRALLALADAAIAAGRPVEAVAIEAAQSGLVAPLRGAR